MNEILTALCTHHRWANLRLIDACAALDDALQEATAPGTFGGIRDTLVHVVANEEGYLALVDGGPRPAREAFAFAGYDDLRRRAERTEGDPIVRGEWRGGPFALPTSVFLTQALHHAAEHRAQVATILGQRGIAPPVLDAWTSAEESGGR